MKLWKHSWLAIALALLCAPKIAHAVCTPFHVQLLVIVLKCKQFSKRYHSRKTFFFSLASLQLCMTLLKRSLFMALILCLYVGAWWVESLFHTFIEGFCAHLNTL